MGKTIERLALAHGDVITCRIDQDNQEEFDSEAFRTSDAAIEFTTPSTARQNVLRCIEAGKAAGVPDPRKEPLAKTNFIR